MTVITPGNFALAEYKRAIYHATPEPGTPFSDVLEPAYWVHVSRQLQPGYKIEVVAQDNSYYAELFVVGMVDRGAKVEVLFHKEFEETKATEIHVDGHIIKFAGAKRLHQVIRVGKAGESVVLREGFRTKREAQDYIDGQLKARAA